MKILLVSTELTQPGRPHGGLANSVGRLAESLVERGHQVRLLCYGESQHAEWRGRVFTEWIPVPCPRWSLALNYASLLQFATVFTAMLRARAIALRVEELGAQGEVEIVHFPNLEGIGLFLPKKLPKICRISSDTLLWKRMGGMDGVSYWRLWQRSLIEQRALARAERIYAPSQRLAAVVEGHRRRHVEVIPPPFFPDETEDDMPVEDGGVEREPFLLFVGTLNRLKGIEEIGASLSTILSWRPDLHFVFAGPEGPGAPRSTWSDWLRECAGEHADRLRFPGSLPHSRLYSLYRKARVVVLPSRVDNLPNTLLEALYHGAIVVGSRGASFDEVIRDGINGFLCESANPASLIKAVRKALVLDETRRAGLQANARETLKEYSPGSVLPHLEKLFAESTREIKP